jgi:DNA polymerase I-like protein with 3'-5' exonuclease and polymerase domains
MLAIDFETHLIGNDSLAPKPVCVSYYDGKKDGLIVGMSEMEQYLEYALSQEKLVAHYFKFEGTVIYRHFPKLREKLLSAIEEGRVYCTKVAEEVLSAQRKRLAGGATLSDCVMRYFKEDISAGKKGADVWRLRYGELEGKPLSLWPKEAVDYAISDSIWAYKVADIQAEAVDLDVAKFTTRAELYLGLMGNTGILVNQDRVNQLEKELLQLLAPSRQYLLENDFMYYDKKGVIHTRNKRLSEYIEKNVEVPIRTDKGGISLSSENLDNYDLENLPPLKHYKDSLEYSKMVNAFVPRLKSAAPYLFTDYKGSVKTGRTSSRTSDHYPSVNIQQMPRKVENVTYDVRNCFVPRPGYYIVSIDYSALELSTCANQLFNHYGESAMLRILNAGNEPLDLHTELGRRLMQLSTGKHVTYEEFFKNKKMAPYAGFRQLAKPLNLGFPGGIGYVTMRSLLYKEGIRPKYVNITKGLNLKPEQSEEAVMFLLRRFQHKYKNLRCEQIGRNQYCLVADELVELKQEMFKLYPDLEDFLKEGHKQYLTGKSKQVKNNFGEWKKEELYSYSIPGGIVRDNCTYTELCNGYLMQSAAAKGAKEAVCRAVKKYYGGDWLRPLAFIHDEILAEVKICNITYELVEDLATIMIDSMRSALPHVRIAVEADIMDAWKKEGGFYQKTFFKNAGENTLRSYNEKGKI